jgi:F0F1-type ATP synthase membrane subunit b/b'
LVKRQRYYPAKLTTQYEQELDSVRKEAQLEITNSQKIHKEILEVELNISQRYIDNLLDTITRDLLLKKDIALDSLDEIVQSYVLILKLDYQSKFFVKRNFPFISEQFI